MANIYVDSAGWTAVAAWTALTAYVSTSNGGRGDYVRQLAGVSAGNERVFRCTTSGTSLASEPTWTLTKNATTTEAAGPVWTECTGQEADQVSGTWKAPHARMQAAVAATWSVAGDTYYLGDDHAETQAAVTTITLPGTVGSPNRILCVLHTGTVPPVSADLRTTATISTTGANGITLSGFFYWYGTIFQTNSAGAGSGGNVLMANNGAQERFDSCVFRPLSTGNSTVSTAAGASIYWNNCSVKFGAAGSSISLTNAGLLVWTNSPTAVDAAGTLPTTLITDGARACTYILDAVDLSALSAKTIFASMSSPTKIYLSNCKLPASITISAAQAGGIGRGDVTMINCDSGALNYRDERHNYAGDQTTETTIIRTGGASDGTQGVAFKVITTANSRWADPFTCLPIPIWNDTSGSSVTATVCGIWGGGAVPNKEDIWIDVEYPSSASTPQGSYITSGNADILATAACASDTSTWGGSTTKFKMAVTFTPQMKGWIIAYVRCAKASSTFYIDPLITLT